MGTLVRHSDIISEAVLWPKIFQILPVTMRTRTPLFFHLFLSFSFPPSLPPSLPPSHPSFILCYVVSPPFKKAAGRQGVGEEFASTTHTCRRGQFHYYAFYVRTAHAHMCAQ